MLPISSIRTPSAVSAGRSRSVSSCTASVSILLGLVPIAGDRLFVGLQDHQALVAVDDHHLAAGDVGQERAGADDGRNFQALGDDRGVAARPADLGDEAADELRSRLAVSLGVRLCARTSTGEVSCESSSRRRPSRFRSSRFSMSKMSLARSARKLLPASRLKDLGIAAQRPADGVFGRVMPLANQAVQLAAQLRIAEHLQVGVEDGAVLVAQFARPRRRGCARFRRRRRRWPCRAVPARRRPRRATTNRRGMRNPSVSITKASPMATPGETAIP